MRAFSECICLTRISVNFIFMHIFRTIILALRSDLMSYKIQNTMGRVTG